MAAFVLEGSCLQSSSPVVWHSPQAHPCFERLDKAGVPAVECLVSIPSVRLASTWLDWINVSGQAGWEIVLCGVAVSRLCLFGTGAAFSFALL